MNDRFDELVGDVADEAERERLRRVHELLLSVDPPADVAAPPAARLRRRPQRLALLAAALAAIAFGAGYLLGGAEAEAVRVIAMAGVGEAQGASASIELLPEDAAGNWPMNVVVRGLEPSGGRSDWYELWLTRDGKRVSPCGRFIVKPGRTEVTLSVPYGLRNYDGWVVTRRGSNRVLLTT
jgi:hypothetical protein